jgi:hypothetical protein
MAKRVNVQLVDDLDGSPAIETVRFGVDGSYYEIDLNQAHAAELRQAVARYVSAGRRAGRAEAKRVDGRRGPRAPIDYDPAAVRAWAAANNVPVSARGRISAAVVQQYRDAGF